MNTNKSYHTILYIEDDLPSRQLMEKFVKSRFDNIILTAKTAEDGIVIADERIPDLIFIDINLPDMTGIDAIKMLKIIPIFKNTKIVALTANTMPDDIKEGIDAGFDEYLTKPIDLDEIAEIIEQL